MLLVVGLALVVGLGVVGQLERARRTAVADATIVAFDSPTSSYPGVSAGRDIRYTFNANGGTLVGQALRSWSVDDVHDAKVCYDPANPSNQMLVKGDAPCP